MPSEEQAKFRLDSCIGGTSEFIHRKAIQRYVFVCNRVPAGPGKPGKSWNFIVAFSRTGMSWKKATGLGKFWKSVNSSKKYEKCGRQ